METGARRALAAALTEARDALVAGRERPRGGELALLDELLADLASSDRLPDGGAAPMAWGLAHVAGRDPDRRATLADAAAMAARRLAPLGDPPASGAAALAWRSASGYGRERPSSFGRGARCTAGIGSTPLSGGR